MEGSDRLPDVYDHHATFATDAKARSGSWIAQMLQLQTMPLFLADLPVLAANCDAAKGFGPVRQDNVTRHLSGGGRCRPCFQPGKIKQLGVKQMRRARIHQCPEHDLPASGAVFFPTIQDLLDLLALQSIL